SPPVGPGLRPYHAGLRLQTHHALRLRSALARSSKLSGRSSGRTPFSSSTARQPPSVTVLNLFLSVPCAGEQITSGEPRYCLRVLAHLDSRNLCVLYREQNS